MATLNTASSIVDFLKSQNKPSDFNSRTTLYETSGLKDAFGDYRGTSEQNVALLRRTQASQPSVAPAITQTKTPEQVINETTPSTISSITDIERGEQEKIQPDIDAELKALGATELRGAETLGRDVAGLKAGAESKVSALSTKGTALQQKLAEQSAGFGGSFSGKVKKGQAEIAQEVSQKQESVRAKLGDDLYGKFSDFERNFGTDFLRTLSIPEAQEFTKLPLPVRGAVVSQSQKIIESAINKARSNAEKTLSSLGYVQLPDGTILQKPSELRAEQAGERAEQRLSLAEQAGQRAEEAARRAELKFNQEGGGTKSDRDARLYNEVSGSALRDLEANKGRDGYYDPGIFTKYRDQLLNSAPTKIDDFDKLYALKLNPLDAIKLGINQAKYQKESSLEALGKALQSGGQIQVQVK